MNTRTTQTQAPAPRRISALSVAVLLLLAACASDRKADPAPPAPSPGTTPPGPTSPPPASPPPVPSGVTPINFASSGEPSFDRWRTEFSNRALAEGRTRSQVISVLSGLRPTRGAVVPAAVDQPEFSRPIWDYVRSALSATRVSNGRARLASTAELAAIEASYGVPREVLTAIWGMETSYGAVLGSTDVPAGLATMAWEGRRKAFAEAELMALIRILELGKVVREQLIGSWAGAMGQTQFMPSTFLNHAVDWEGDNRKDLWRSAPDALASAANYLKASGWRAGQPWGVEVALPDGFNYGLADGARRSVAGLAAFGVTLPGGAPLPLPTGQAELFAPAGSHGPVFALYANFDVIKRYNNADSYALAVGLLADTLAGRPGLVKQWPVGMRLLSTVEARDLQQRLTNLGYDTKGVDGVIGRNTRAALQRFQADRGLLADGYPTVEMLAAVRAASGG